MEADELIAKANQDTAEQELQLQKDMAGHFMAGIQARVLMAEKCHEMGKKVIMVDIDGTICKQDGDPRSSDDAYSFRTSKPFLRRIEYLNSLHEEGHYIHYWSARGCWDGKDTLEETRAQLDSWGVKYNDVAVFKPFYDIWIDDKGVSVNRDEIWHREFTDSIDQAIEML
ncbi:MAG TPA: hypothetical protein EYF95_03395 [Flavobacteriales bacterium]|jgi:hypothetical protein|nr:hypothetical protein [Flavobacteriales bacterium]